MINLNKILSIIAYIVVYILMIIYQYPKELSGQIPIIILVSIGIILCLMIFNRMNHILRIAMALAFVMIFSSLINYDGSTKLGIMICYICMWFMAMNVTHIYNYQADNKKHFLKISTVYCFIAIYLYTLYTNSDYSITNKFYTITTVYYLLCTLPIVLVIKSKRLRTILVIFIVVGVILSFKRSALVTLCVVAIAFFLKMKNLKKWYKYAVLFLMLVICLLMFFNQNTELVFNIQNIWVNRFFGTSNTITDVREDVYLEVIRLQMNSSFTEWIIGHGYNAVQYVTSTGYSAHNDYLEVLYDYGIFAFILYIRLIIALIELYWRKVKDPDYPSFSLLVSICIFCVSSIFSHLMTYPTYFLILSLYWGWITPIRLDDKGANVNRQIKDIV